MLHAVLYLCGLLFCSSCASTNWRPSPQQTPGANQLPLSGRGNGNGSVTATQSAVPGTTTSVNTINTTVQTSGPYAGSASSAAMPFSGKLSFRQAIDRGLQYNLGAIGLNDTVRQATGASHVVRSSLLPNLTSSLTETLEQTNLRALGVRISSPFPGFGIPTIVGPFNYFDLRARLTQTVANLTDINNYRSAKETVKANELSVRDARDLVVLAVVGGAYLEVIAAQARVESARAQIQTAEAQSKQASEQRAAGVLCFDRFEPQRGSVTYHSRTAESRSRMITPSKRSIWLGSRGCPPTKITKSVIRFRFLRRRLSI